MDSLLLLRSAEQIAGIPVAYWASVSVGIVLAFLALLLFRRRRLKRWQRALAGPSSAFADPHAKWAVGLSEEIRCSSDSPLFETLYGTYRSRPGLFAPPKAIESILQPPTTELPAIAVCGISPDLPENAHAEKLERQTLEPSADPSTWPADSVASGVLRNLVPVVKGDKPLKDGVEHAVLDSLGPGGGLAGAKAGGALGLFAAPFVLAGVAAYAVPLFMILGAWAGAAVGRKLGRRVRARKIFAALKRLRTTSWRFKRRFLTHLSELRTQLGQNLEARVRYTENLKRARRSSLARYFFPDLITVFLESTLKQLRLDHKADLARFRELRAKVLRMSPIDFVVVMSQMRDRDFLEDPELRARFDAYEAANRELEDARKLAA